MSAVEVLNEIAPNRNDVDSVKQVLFMPLNEFFYTAVLIRYTQDGPACSHFSLYAGRLPNGP